jgi:hypothetical protein
MNPVDPLSVYFALGSAIMALDATLMACFQKEHFADVMKSIQDSLDVIADEHPVLPFIAVAAGILLCVSVWPVLAVCQLYRSIRG